MSPRWCNVLLFIGALLTMAMDSAHAQAFALSSSTNSYAKMLDQAIACALMLVALVVTYLIH